MNKTLFSLSHKLIGSLAFLRALSKAPLEMGMICPSSPFLTKELAHQIPDVVVLKLQNQQKLECCTSLQELECCPNSQKKHERQGYIIELGAGTGAVTKALLQRGVPPTRILIFEQSPTMAGLLMQRFPGMRVIQDDAANMANYLPKNAYIASIVSSLPFVSLPATVSANIIDAIQKNIGTSPIIQYTYALNKKTILEENGFAVNKKHTIWANLPPAHVMTYTFNAPTK